MRKRILSTLLALVMCFSMLPTEAWAAEQDGTKLCPHHTKHTEECGYIPQSVGTPCAHEHTDDCYTLVESCVHEHDESCYSGGIPFAEDEEKEADICTHACTVESGCVTRTEECGHEHDAECGYAESVDGAPCNFVCEICTGLTEETEVSENTEETIDIAVSSDNTKTIEITVDEVKALIDALPSVEDMKKMDEESQRTAHDQIQAPMTHI